MLSLVLLLINMRYDNTSVGEKICKKYGYAFVSELELGYLVGLCQSNPFYDSVI